MGAKILKIYAIAALLGILTGTMGSLFQLGIRWLSAAFNKGLMQFSHHTFLMVLVSMSFSMLAIYLAWIMVKKIAPEASGSGVQEIEGVLLGQRPIFWRRLLPVKFFGGILSNSSNLVVGREGPTIQMGGNLAAMLGEWFRIPTKRRNTLIASGAAAGLATAFNAPLAGVLFVMEEMRNQFNFNFTNFKMVAIACTMATIMEHAILGPEPAIAMHVFTMPSIKSLWMFFIFGIIIGFAGLLFNIFLIKSLNLKDKLSPLGQKLFVLAVGALVGLLFVFHPQLVGGGYTIINQSLLLSPSLDVLLVLIVARFITTLLSYNVGVPGGIFAPLLALGTLSGLAVYQLLIGIMPDVSVHPGMFAVAGMGALFSAAVRAPVTGIVLVVEMTQNYSLILPLMVSCLTSTTVVQLAKNQPIYSQLLRRTLRIAAKAASPSN